MDETLLESRVASAACPVPSRPAPAAPAGDAAKKANPTLKTASPCLPRLILRFQKSERLLHWSIAVPFMVCYSTALILVLFYNPHPQRAFRAAFSWAHRISGVCLIVFPLLTAVRNRDDFRLHLDNIKQTWSWAFGDFKWLVFAGAAAVCKRISLPEQGKFNAAEKLNFMMVMCTYPLFILTGLLVWTKGFGMIESWLIHFALAALATPLMLGHIFMATINPDTRVGIGGMLSGYVDRQWAKHHYRRWYRENFEAQERPAGQRVQPTTPGPGPARSRKALIFQSSLLP